MIVKESRNFRIITVPAYNGCLPNTAYMVQRRQERKLLSDKWVNVKGYESRMRAEELYKTLTD